MSTNIAKNSTVVSVPVKPHLYHWLRSKYGVNSAGEIVVNDKREPGGIMLEIYKTSMRKRAYYYRHHRKETEAKYSDYMKLYIRYIPKNDCEVCMFDDKGIYFFNRTFDLRFKDMMMMYIYANVENGSNSIKSSLLKFLTINGLGEDDVNFDSLMRYIMRRMDKEVDRLTDRARFLLGLYRRPSAKRPVQQKKTNKNKGVLSLNLIFESTCQGTPALT